MKLRFLTLIAAAAATLALPGCANGANDAPGSSAGTGSSAGVGSGSPTPAEVPTSPPPPAGVIPPTPGEKTGGPTGPVGESGALTITGQITAGVEPNCKLISDGSTSYLLVGGDQSVLKVGARVTVSGTAETDLLTTCQQGTPLRVNSAHPS